MARWRVLHNMAGVGLSIVVTCIVLLLRLVGERLGRRRRAWRARRHQQMHSHLLATGANKLVKLLLPTTILLDAKEERGVALIVAPNGAFIQQQTCILEKHEEDRAFFRRMCASYGGISCTYSSHSRAR